MSIEQQSSPYGSRTWDSSERLQIMIKFEIILTGNSGYIECSTIHESADPINAATTRLPLTY